MKRLLLFTLICITTTGVLSAQDLEVELIRFGTDVQNREIVEADSLFPNTVERVYCLTEISGGDGEATVTHVWYHNNEERARVELPVRSDSWRTWSSKRILESWTGNWSVDIVDPSGEILTSKEFTIEATE